MGCRTPNNRVHFNNASISAPAQKNRVAPVQIGGQVRKTYLVPALLAPHRTTASNRPAAIAMFDFFPNTREVSRSHRRCATEFRPRPHRAWFMALGAVPWLHSAFQSPHLRKPTETGGNRLYGLFRAPQTDRTRPAVRFCPPSAGARHRVLASLYPKGDHGSRSV